MTVKPQIIDTETTGFAEGAQIVEFASMTLPGTPAEFVKTKFEDMPQEQFYCGYDCNYELGAMAVTGIKPSTLEGLPKFEDKGPKAGYVIGHKVDFDVKMTDRRGAKAICTLAIAKAMFPHLDSHTQGAVLLHVAVLTGKGFDWAIDLIKNSHSADTDVLNCGRIFKYMVFMLLKKTAAEGIKGELSWEDVYQYSQDCRIPKIMDFGKFKGLPIEAVESSWVDWYSKQADTDPYLMIAFRRAGLIKEA